jgi:hypothetical protein
VRVRVKVRVSVRASVWVGFECVGMSEGGLSRSGRGSKRQAAGGDHPCARRAADVSVKEA